MEHRKSAPGPARRWGILAVVCGGLFMIMLQSNVINLAVPRIQKDFGASLSMVEWITNGYLLAFTALLILLGRLGDRIGRKALFLGGLVVYVAGSLIAGFAQDLGVIIGGAAVQGVGGAAMMPATLSLIQVSFEPRERGIALGIWGAVSGLAVAVGPTLGGYLTDIGLGAAVNSVLHLEQGWRAIYFLNSFLGAAVFLCAHLVLVESRVPGPHRRFDILGTVLSAAAQFLFVFALIGASRYGWLLRRQDFTLFGAVVPTGPLSITPILIVIALAVGALFVLRERSTRIEPLMDLSLFRNKSFTAGSLVAAILNFSMMGTFFLIPVFLQGVLGYTAIKTGLTLIPLAAAVIVASPVAGRLTDRIGARWVIVAGMVILCVGGFLTARFSPGTTSGALVFPFILQGLGIGLAIAPITNAALFTVPLDRAGSASGTLSTIRQFGSILGIAILAGVFSSGMSGAMRRTIDALDTSVVPQTVKEKIVGGLEGVGSERPSDEQMKKFLSFYSKKRGEEIMGAVSGAMKQGLVDSINSTFRYAAGVAALGAGAALLLGGRRKEKAAKRSAKGGAA